jgi:hypothetical protein
MTGSAGLLVDWNVSACKTVIFVTSLTFLGIALYILLWPEDGKLKKNDILGVFDGTIFGQLASQRTKSAACG